jgi:hypothetical protein
MPAIAAHHASIRPQGCASRLPGLIIRMKSPNALRLGTLSGNMFFSACGSFRQSMSPHGLTST